MPMLKFLYEQTYFWLFLIAELHKHEYNSESALMQVISSMRVLMTEDSNNAVSSSFLLDDDSR